MTTFTVTKSGVFDETLGFLTKTLNDIDITQYEKRPFSAQFTYTHDGVKQKGYATVEQKGRKISVAIEFYHHSGVRVTNDSNTRTLRRILGDGFDMPCKFQYTKKNTERIQGIIEHIDRSYQRKLEHEARSLKEAEVASSTSDTLGKHGIDITYGSGYARGKNNSMSVQLRGDVVNTSLSTRDVDLVLAMAELIQNWES